MTRDADRLLATARRALEAAGLVENEQVVLDRRVRDGYEKALLSLRTAGSPDADLARSVLTALKDRRLRLGPFDEAPAGEDMFAGLARGGDFFEILKMPAERAK